MTSLLAHLRPSSRRRVRHLLLTLVTCAAWAVLAAPTATAAAAAGASDPVGVWPLVPQPEVVRGFDPPDEPWGAGHRGVDLLGHPGQRVRSALPGRVSWSGVLAGRGVVVVDHGDTRATYEPLDERAPVGSVVAAGDRIGRLSVIGSHCAPRSCLHWGWIDGETYLNPLRLVGIGPVRLLPLWRESPVTGAPTSAGGTRPESPYADWRPALAVVAPLVHARGWACW